MGGRKIGVGFNQPRIIGNHNRRDIDSEWMWARRMSRMVRNRRWKWEKPWGASAVEARQSIIRDIEGKL